MTHKYFFLMCSSNVFYNTFIVKIQLGFHGHYGSHLRCKNYVKLGEQFLLSQTLQHLFHNHIPIVAVPFDYTQNYFNILNYRKESISHLFQYEGATFWTSDRLREMLVTKIRKA